MDQFLRGAIAMAYGVAGLFFLRFWKETRDRLFAIFALAFWLLALTRIAMAVTGLDSEAATWIYWIRLASYLLILAAIIDKNRPLPPKAGHP
jgi:uncharacterized membrane protein YeiB